MDNGCDQSIINNNAFYVKSFAGVLYNIGGALHGMHASSLELVNEAYTLLTLPDSRRIYFIPVDNNLFTMILTRVNTISGW